jgi:hypothetical protein
MSKDIESQMRAALRPVAPSEDFSEKLIARALSEQSPQLKSRPHGWAGSRRSAWWLSAAVAASIILAVGVERHLREQRLMQSGLEARREVVEALRMTSQKLNLAYEVVKSQSTSLADEKPGA